MILLISAFLISGPSGVEETGDAGVTVGLNLVTTSTTSTAIIAARITTSVAAGGADARHLAGVHAFGLNHAEGTSIITGEARRVLIATPIRSAG